MNAEIKPGAPRLYAQAEISHILGVSGTRVGQLANEPGFPLPIARLKVGRIWLADDIDEWVRLRDERRGARR